MDAKANSCLLICRSDFDLPQIQKKGDDSYLIFQKRDFTPDGPYGFIDGKYLVFFKVLSRLWVNWD